MMMLLATPLLAAAQADPVEGGKVAPTYVIDSAVWCSGELRGEPELTLAAGIPGTFEIHSPESSWRLSVEVEAPGETEGAAPESLWFKVGIEQRVDGEWEFLTDTMLGTPLGKPGIITVVDDGEQDSSPKTAPLYVELTARRVDGE
ncbi:MAG: hypothetical protein WD397_05795 [Wenzhouxiangellaceae bacterium]